MRSVTVSNPHKLLAGTLQPGRLQLQLGIVMAVSRFQPVTAAAPLWKPGLLRLRWGLPPQHAAEAAPLERCSRSTCMVEHLHVRWPELREDHTVVS